MTKTRMAFGAIILLLSLMISVNRIYQFELGLDFSVFQRTVTWPLDQLYHDPGPMPFLYPPTAILLFKPFAMLPAGFLFWTLGSALAFAAAVLAVSGKRVAFLSFLCPAAIGGLILGQVPMILAAALFAGLKLRPLLGGLLWGLAAAIKPHLMLFAPIALIIRRDWAMLGGMAAGLGVTVVASLALFGFDLWFEWIAAVREFGSRVSNSPIAVWTITPAGKAALLGLPSVPFLIAGAVIGAAAVIASARKVENELLIALFAAAGIVSSPYANAHDLIAIIPACVVMLLRGPRWAALIAAMPFIGAPILAMTGLMGGLVAAAACQINSIRAEDKRQLNPARN